MVWLVPGTVDFSLVSLVFLSFSFLFFSFGLMVGSCGVWKGQNESFDDFQSLRRFRGTRDRSGVEGDIRISLLT